MGPAGSGGPNHQPRNASVASAAASAMTPSRTPGIPGGFPSAEAPGGVPVPVPVPVPAPGSAVTWLGDHSGFGLVHDHHDRFGGLGQAIFEPHHFSDGQQSPPLDMDQLENQVTDLRYLSQAPGPLADPVYESHTPQTHPQPQPSPGGSASIGDNSAPPYSVGATPRQTSQAAQGGANKRKSIDDDGGSSKQTRSKRNRYISIACNECKRRKIKCNGETPCQRCGNLNLACLYAPNCCSNNFRDTDEYKQVNSQIGGLIEEVTWLKQTVKALQNDNNRLAPLQDRSLPAISPSPSYNSAPAQRSETSYVKYGSFRGPTSMAYSLDVANDTISNMGYKGIGDGEDQAGPQRPEDGADRTPGQPVTHDALLDFDKDEMVRLCRLHEEEIGIMYPVLDIQTVISHAKSLALFIESTRNQRPLEALNDEETMKLKMVMCCALVVEGHGHSDKAVRLYESMEAVLNRKLMADTSSTSSLPLFALLAGYRFLSNDEILAWRVIGQVARLCIELGIHRSNGLMKIRNESERKDALVSFWSAYVLDRRWAFGTGLPYVLQDDEIDPQLPLPDEHPYLAAMVTYSKLCAKVWRQVTHFEPVLARELRQEEIDRLDDEILQWYETVPEEVKVRNWTNKHRQLTSTPSYNLQRLRIWTYLRLNQLRIWLYTPVLHSATSIMANPSQAQRVVDLAKDTIQYLHHLNSTTNLYRRIQVFYHQFLTSAISVVFLASVHAPVRFSAVCREEFYLALELVKGLSVKSWVSQRLWRTIRSLKDVAPRFGLNPDDDPHSSAALGMIGLARGHMDTGSGSRQSPFQRPSMPSRDPSHQPPPGTEHNGTMIQSEMSRIFEGYVGLNGFQPGNNDDGDPESGSELQRPRSTEVYANDGTVFPHLREMF